LKFPAPWDSFGVELCLVGSVTLMHVICDFRVKEFERHFLAQSQKVQHGRHAALSEMTALRHIIPKEVEDEIRHR
jgi:hypothetical protein